MPRFFLFIFFLNASTYGQRLQSRSVGRLTELFAWKQITYNINNYDLLTDRFDPLSSGERLKRATNDFIFPKNTEDDNNYFGFRPSTEPSITAQSSTTVNPRDEVGRFYIKYNNVPMGLERVGDRVFITVPRRRYGIPATLNYVDLNKDGGERSPPLRPYPDMRRSRSLVSVYRTRADACGRLWMIDTGRLEIPGNHQQLQPPAIVIYDLATDKQILRYPFKTSDVPAENTPTGLASITVDIINNNCDDTFAYVPDLTSYGLIVFSLRERDSWRLSHNYFFFNPTAGELSVGSTRFQWSDGIFSLTLAAADRAGCRAAYFHPLVSTQEFTVSTCLLRNRTAADDSGYWSQFGLVGDRGERSQSTMHGYHEGSKVIFFADVAKNAVLCWQTGTVLSPATVAVLAQDNLKLSYPSDLHVIGDEVWVMANSLTRFGYSRLDPNEYNFFAYRAKVRDLIAGTVCEARSSYTG